ncbi:MAG: DUF58 domain-containing protein [Flavobacteriales bacterium]|nr:DUF58 domain-containing protein [Flavobacteriales bacterium]
MIVLDIIVLYLGKGQVTCERTLPEKLSNGDDNNVFLVVTNQYPFQVRMKVLEELPEQFQVRDKTFTIDLAPGERTVITYIVRPSERGEYHFGKTNLYASTMVGLIERRVAAGEDTMVPVYPGFLQMRKYEFLAISNRSMEFGIKRMRRVGHSYEFDQIRKYVQGDDIRSVNWKATARSADLMVNQYQDERAQNVYVILNVGRVMKMPFKGLTLLDHAVNSALIMLNVALNKDDKAGLITFSNKIHASLTASNKHAQLNAILETLYNVKTDFAEADYESMYYNLTKTVKQRSLLLMYVNFESMFSLQRELTYLKRLARKHLVVVIFFKNTELYNLTEKQAVDTEGIYIRTIASKFMYEKELIAKELERFGIQSILTTPENLTVDAINKYLELKMRGMI